MTLEPAYSFVIPTFKRPDVLELCLDHIANLDYDLSKIEVICIDNAEAENTQSVALPFQQKLHLEYIVNEKNGGPGFSINRGIRKAVGKRIVISNDDALVPPHFLKACDEILDADPRIGCLGFRPIEKGYHREGEGIGVIDHDGTVVGNFDLDPGKPLDVDHIYGFCYLITRQAYECAGPTDEILLATKIASGDRIETDQCLSIKRAGLRVVFLSTLAIEHLAKPRTDIKERSPRWRLNHIRNTLYMFLKQYGVFGKGALALRFTLTHDVGIISLLKQPNSENFEYFRNGMSARFSAWGHYFKYLVSGRRVTPYRPA